MKTQCKIFDCNGLINLQEQVDTWLELKTKETGFLLAHTDMEVFTKQTGPQYVLIVFYTTES